MYGISGKSGLVLMGVSLKRSPQLTSLKMGMLLIPFLGQE